MKLIYTKDNIKIVHIKLNKIKSNFMKGWN